MRGAYLTTSKDALKCTHGGETANKIIYILNENINTKGGAGVEPPELNKSLSSFIVFKIK